MDGLYEKFKYWVENSLSKPKQEFNNLPACPFAKEAIDKSKFQFFYCQENLEDKIEEAYAAFFNNKKEVVLLASATIASTKELDLLLSKFREKYFMKNAWLLLDDPKCPESVGGLSLNFQEAVVFIIQDFRNLMKATEELKAKGYYKSWSKNYYDEVVGSREKYHARLACQNESPHVYPNS